MKSSHQPGRMSLLGLPPQQTIKSQKIDRLLQCGFANRLFFCSLSCLVLASISLTGSAQDVVASAPAEEIVPIAVQEARAAQGILPMTIGPISAADTKLFELGPATLRSHLTYTYLYGDGIPSP